MMRIIFLLLIPENQKDITSHSLIALDHHESFWGAEPLLLGWPLNQEPQTSVGKQTPQKRDGAKFLTPSLFQYLQLGGGGDEEGQEC